VSADDVRIDRVDLTRSASPLIGADEPLADMIAVRAIAPGEALRRDLVKPIPVIAAGDPVRIVYDGPGFAASIDGKALAAAGDGQPIKVATATGRVLNGVARPGQLVVVK
jgi:flagella basal body P-ring formation protein FlgA